MNLLDFVSILGFALFINGIAYGNFWMMLVPLLGSGIADWVMG